MFNAFSLAINRAFEKTARLLWPVRRDVWLKLFFLCLFTGSGFHSGLRIPFTSTNTPAARFTSAKSALSPATAGINALHLQWNLIKSMAVNFWADNRWLILQAAILLGAIVIIAWIMLLWVASRLQFVFVTALVNEQVHIRKYWNETERLGESYFYLRLGIFLVGILSMIAGIGAVANKITALSWPPAAVAILPMLIKAGLIFTATLPAFIFLYSLERFLPIVMLLTNQTTLPALRRSAGFLFHYPLRAIGLVVGTTLFSFALSIAMMIALVVGTIVVGGILSLTLLAVGLALKFIFHAGSIGLIVTGFFIASALALVVLMIAVVPVSVVTGFLRLEVVKSQLTDETVSPP